MNWEQKLMALKALCDTHLCMRKPGDWYVSAYGRDVVESEGCILAGSYGNGRTPQEAVESDWSVIAEPGHALKITGKGYMRWNGFMWETLRDLECAMPFIKRRKGGA